MKLHEITPITSEAQYKLYIKRIEDMKDVAARHSVDRSYDLERTMEIRRLYRMINDWRERKGEPEVQKPNFAFVVELKKAARKKYTKKQKNG